MPSLLRNSGNRNPPQAAFGQSSRQSADLRLLRHRPLFFSFRYRAAMNFIVLLESRRFFM
jgi:hypothetical protein